jgi:DNA mismatch repair protein MutS
MVGPPEGARGPRAEVDVPNSSPKAREATPVMQQYRAARDQHPDGLLFFRMGDFFELFFEDAEKASRLLGLTLTSRDKGEAPVPMAGVPVRNAETYVNRLIRMGEKVVICDQVQDPREASGIIDRAVVRVITPGTVTEDSALSERDHNFLCAVVLDGARAGIAYADLSTGSFFAIDQPKDALVDFLHRIDPAELLLPDSSRDAGSPYAAVRDAVGRPASTLEGWAFDRGDAISALCEHYKVRTLEGFGLGDLGPAIGAAGGILRYLQQTQGGAVQHLLPIRRPATGDALVLDRTTRSSLELVRTLREGTREGSLLGVMDRTRTACGGRLLKSWVLEPLARVPDILHRQDGVADLVADAPRLKRLREALAKVHDVERLIARISCGRASARELVSLRETLARLPEISAIVETAEAPILREARARLPDLSALRDLLQRALVDEPPPTVRDGGMIRRGFQPELDELHSLRHDGKDWIARYQADEAARTGIGTLKVAYNRVFGWYIEVTHAQAAKVPAEYVRRQTVKNAERYVTQQLKDFEGRVMHAEERINDLEYEVFLDLRKAVLESLPKLQAASSVLALVDALQSLAQIAREWQGCRPEIEDGLTTTIREGRHPVLAFQPGAHASFVPNDLVLDEDRRLILITGPNMAGKSTYIRQSALLVLLAQMGAFIPAASATIGVVDRILTRVGASDEIAKGHSTFMVEMIETANILHHATDRSLVILDEVGRGTSTFDGLAIAWAITEHLATKTRCRALFATHYHQLVALGESLPRTASQSVAVREWGEEIVFLHKIVDGGTDRSYGIHVARLAGLPAEVVARARAVLAEVESGSAGPRETPRKDADQLSLFPEPEGPAIAAIRAVDLDRLTPIDALVFLRELKSKID